jgi:hypothetical protein
MTDQPQPAAGETPPAGAPITEIVLRQGTGQPPANPAAPAKLRKKDRIIKALELRKQGGSFRKIAKQLAGKDGVSPKYSEGAAYKDCMEGLRRLNDQEEELVAENRRLDLERIDDLWAQYYPKALKGDMLSFNALMQMQDRRTRLLGLDKVQTNRSANLNIDISKLPNDALIRIANGEDPLDVILSLATLAATGTGRA